MLYSEFEDKNLKAMKPFFGKNKPKLDDRYSEGDIAYATEKKKIYVFKGSKWKIAKSTDVLERMMQIIYYVTSPSFFIGSKKND